MAEESAKRLRLDLVFSLASSPVSTPSAVEAVVVVTSNLAATVAKVAGERTLQRLHELILRTLRARNELNRCRTGCFYMVFTWFSRVFTGFCRVFACFSSVFTWFSHHTITFGASS